MDWVASIEAMLRGVSEESHCWSIYDKQFIFLGWWNGRALAARIQRAWKQGWPMRRTDGMACLQAC